MNSIMPRYRVFAMQGFTATTVRLIAFLTLVLLNLTGCEPETPAPETRFPYNESADAHNDVKAAFLHAENKKVLLIFGANWCPDCRKFDAQLMKEPLLTAILNHYVLVKIDIGQFDKNMDIADAYGKPTSKGIPAAAITDSTGHVIKIISGDKLVATHKRSDDALLDLLDVTPQ
jgi:thioredoxin 1